MLRGRTKNKRLYIPVILSWGDCAQKALGEGVCALLPSNG